MYKWVDEEQRYRQADQGKPHPPPVSTERDFSKIVGVKEWFLKKNLTQDERLIYEYADRQDYFTVVRVTEKAVQIALTTDYGTLKKWFPKSVVLTEGETDPDVERRAAAMDRGLAYNTQLLNLAKENGVKGVRRGMKTVTLQEKLREAGVDFVDDGKKRKPRKRSKQKRSNSGVNTTALYNSLSEAQKRDYVTINGKTYVRAIAEANGLLKKG